LADFRNILKDKISYSPSIADGLFRADGRKDMTKLIVASRNFAKAPKNTRKSGTLAKGTRYFSHKFRMPFPRISLFYRKCLWRQPPSFLSLPV